LAAKKRMAAKLGLRAGDGHRTAQCVPERQNLTGRNPCISPGVTPGDHPARANLGDDFVAAEPGARGERHGSGWNYRGREELGALVMKSARGKPGIPRVACWAISRRRLAHRQAKAL
jgi:hypothetical protein